VGGLHAPTSGLLLLAPNHLCRPASHRCYYFMGFLMSLIFACIFTFLVFCSSFCILLLLAPSHLNRPVIRRCYYFMGFWLSLIFAYIFTFHVFCSSFCILLLVCFVGCYLLALRWFDLTLETFVTNFCSPYIKLRQCIFGFNLFPTVVAGS
jgi:hypothetical protein